ncbi:uncharacterized protein EV420DRAFT_1487523 [Desarmillaria tabescens]|uniref:Uncharacterized protein n=1 Tax=Armillaria tabescens TaxID=1929756 RepID=A0AA39J6G1_ARMTA|nr:uncharacterized protein EV420DRAFT_1487523 [Desarmillaria tabescens]KAK0436335.1 hypothetical protein EV420DRAFT_1487523 [Desarmillaria tabescens]
MSTSTRSLYAPSTPSIMIAEFTSLSLSRLLHRSLPPAEFFPFKVVNVEFITRTDTNPTRDSEWRTGGGSYLSSILQQKYLRRKDTSCGADPIRRFCCGFTTTSAKSIIRRCQAIEHQRPITGWYHPTWFQIDQGSGRALPDVSKVGINGSNHRHPVFSWGVYAVKHSVLGASEGREGSSQCAMEPISGRLYHIDGGQDKHRRWGLWCIQTCQPRSYTYYTPLAPFDELSSTQELYEFVFLSRRFLTSASASLHILGCNQILFDPPMLLLFGGSSRAPVPTLGSTSLCKRVHLIHIEDEARGESLGDWMTAI